MQQINHGKDIVPSLLKAIVRLDGDTLVMCVDQQPYVTTPDTRVAVGSRNLPLAVISDILDDLLSPQAQRTLNAAGQVECRLSGLPDSEDCFTLVATDRDALRVVIHRSRPGTGRSLAQSGHRPVSGTEHAGDVRSMARATAPAGARKRFPPLVLYIEDSADQLDLYEVALTDRYQFLGALHGETGLNLAIAEQPDLVVVDLNMPGMNGWTVCRHLKADSRTASIPIVILTAESAVESLRDKARKVGAADFIEKPCSIDALRKHIDLVLQLSRS